MSRFITDARFNYPYVPVGDTLNAGMRTGMALAEMREKNRQRRTLGDITREATVTDEFGNTRIDEPTFVRRLAEKGIDPSVGAQWLGNLEGARKAQEEQQYSAVMRERFNPQSGEVDYPGARGDLASKGLTARAFDMEKMRISEEERKADRAAKNRELDLREKYIRAQESKLRSGSAGAQSLRLKLERNDARLEAGEITPEEHLRNEQAIIGSHGKLDMEKKFSEMTAERMAYNTIYPTGFAGMRDPNAPLFNSKEWKAQWEEIKRERGIANYDQAPLAAPSTPEGYQPALPPGLPPGTQPIGDGYYRLPSGKTVRAKQQ